MTGQQKNNPAGGNLTGKEHCLDTDSTTQRTKKQPRSRVFNIMQYENHPTTGEALLSESAITQALDSHTTEHWAYIRHDKDTQDDGALKPPHWHVVLATTHTYTPDVIAKWFGIAPQYVGLPKGRGALLDCVGYLTHEDCPDKAQYPASAVHAQPGWDWHRDIEAFQARKKARQAAAENKYIADTWIAAIGRGEQTLAETWSIATAMEAIPEYIKAQRQLLAARATYISQLPPPSTRYNFLLTGPGGIGKTLAARALARALCPNAAPNACFFTAGAAGATFEGYDGEPCIIWDDARPAALLAALGGRDNLLCVLDSHPLDGRQNIKYASINLPNTYNILTSVLAYDDFLNQLAGDYKDKWGNQHASEDFKQIYRRFPAIIPIRKADFDVLINKGWANNTDEYGTYLQYMRGVGSFAAIRRRLAAEGIEPTAIELHAQSYDAKLLEQPVDIIHRILLPAATEADPEAPDAARIIYEEGLAEPPQTHVPAQPEEILCRVN